MDTLGGRFLSESESDLVDSKYVQYDVEQKGIKDSPVEEQIASWVDTMGEIHIKHRDDEKVMDRIRNYYHEKYVIKGEDFPESYFANQQRLAREDGYGYIEITDEVRKVGIETVQKDQKQSLDIWINYFTSPDSAHLPTWTKYWAFNGVVKLGRYNEETKQFEPRMKDTVAPFVEMNPEALAYALSTLQKKYGQEYFDLTDRITEENIQLKKAETLDKQKRILELVDEQGSKQTGKVIMVKDEETGRVMNVKRKDIQKMQEDISTLEDLDSEQIKKGIEDLTSQRSKVLEDRGVPHNISLIDIRNENFGKLYAYAKNEVTPAVRFEKEITEGKWVKYDQGSDYKKLYNSLQGHGTGWCTAGGEGTAKLQLDGGDFYVFYSNDLEGNPVNPRIAIRMNGHNEIGEIRGVAKEQNLDSQISESGVLEKKLEEFGDEGDKYYQKVENMKRMTEIERRTHSNIPLTKDDIVFLYEFDREIEGFGYGRDPRIMEVRSRRNLKKDLEYVVGMPQSGLSGDVILAHLLMDEGYDSILIKYLYSFAELGNSVADRLMDSGNGCYIAEHLDSFSNANHNDIANRLIDSGQGKAVTRNLNKFVGLDHVAIAYRLIDSGQGEAVTSYLDKFVGLDHVGIADRLMDSGQGEAVANNLDKFRDLEGSIAYRLIDSGQGEAVARNLNKFIGLDHVGIADRLIDSGQGKVVMRNLGKFKDLEGSIAYRLIDSGQGEAVARNLNKFIGLDHLAIAHRLIDRGESENVSGWISDFSGLDSSVAYRLIGENRSSSVFKYLGSFKDLDSGIARLLLDDEGVQAFCNGISSFTGLDSSIANKLIDKGRDKVIVNHFDRFENLDNSIVNRLIDRNFGIIKDVANHLDRFIDLDSSIANKLIFRGYGYFVIQHFSSFKDLDLNEVVDILVKEDASLLAENIFHFEGLNHVAIADRLMDSGQGEAVARNLDKFIGLDHVAIADRLMNSGQGEAVARNLDKFIGLDHVAIADRLMNTREGAEWLARYLYNFHGLNHKDIADKMIARGHIFSVVKNLRNFSGLDHNEVADKLIGKNDGYFVMNLGEFKGLNSSIANKLINSDSSYYVVQNLYSFSNLDGNIANKLIDEGWGIYVARHLFCFSNLDGNIANKLIDRGWDSYVTQNLSSFTNLDSNTLDRLK